MDKFIGWLNSKFTHPLVPLFFLFGSLLILLGISNGFNVPTLNEVVIDPAFRWISIIIGFIFITLAIVFYYRPPKFTNQLERQSQDHDQRSLKDYVKVLKEKLLERNFRPDLIIGVARSGLAVSALLSSEFGEPIIPVISLWPHQTLENPFNNLKYDIGNFDPESFIRILIVDDICRSGRTLNETKKYVEKNIGRPNFKIETAAISFYRDNFSQKIAPSYFVNRPEEPILDLTGKEEPLRG